MQPEERHPGHSSKRMPFLVRRLSSIYGSQGSRIILCAPAQSGSCIKDLLASSLIERVRAVNPLCKTVVDVSAGRYGVALSRLASAVGMSARIYVAMMPAVPDDHVALLRRHGASVVFVDGDREAARQAASWYTRKRASESVFLDQYGDVGIHAAAYNRAAAALLQGLPPVDALVTCGGTGGILRVFGDRVRACQTNIRLVRARYQVSGAWADGPLAFASPADTEDVRIGDAKLLRLGQHLLAKEELSISCAGRSVVHAACTWRHKMGKARTIGVLVSEGPGNGLV